MAKLAIAPGSTSQTVYVFVGDSASTTGAGKTGIAYNAAGLTAYYVRVGAAAAPITLATQTAAGAWSSGGWAEVDSTYCPGLYRLDVPNAVLAAGVRSALVYLRGASGMVPTVLEIDLTNEGKAVTVSDKTGYKLASDGVDLVVIESGVNLRQATSVIFAAAGGAVSGADTSTVTIKGGNTSTTRVQADCDLYGNRTNVTLTLPA